MIRVYFLPVITTNHCEEIAGIEFVHDAILEATPDPMLRCLIQDTTTDEHDGLISVATSWRDADQLEIDLYNTYDFPWLPTPDELRAEEILHNPSIPIPAPDLADLVRIFGRRLGYHF